MQWVNLRKETVTHRSHTEKEQSRGCCQGHLLQVACYMVQTTAVQDMLSKCRGHHFLCLCPLQVATSYDMLSAPAV